MPLWKSASGSVNLTYQPCSNKCRHTCHCESRVSNTSSYLAVLRFKHCKQVLGSPRSFRSFKCGAAPSMMIFLLLIVSLIMFCQIHSVQLTESRLTPEDWVLFKVYFSAKSPSLIFNVLSRHVR